MVETDIGTVRVRHRPYSPLFASPRRAVIENQVVVDLTFEAPQTFRGALERALLLLRFLILIGGRPQNIEWMTLDLVDDAHELPLEVYWCMPPTRQTRAELEPPHPAEILIDAVRTRAQFETVVRDWVSLEPTRRDAREQFSENFSEQRMFGPERLVSAANMFDLLPDDALPNPPELDPALIAARDQARALFRKLPASDERASILGALGRVGTRTLKQKIAHRASIVSTALVEPLAHLELVVDEAVKCRNHLVHGSPTRIDYAEHWHLRAFLTRALEFFFAASDLIDAGWDARAWQLRGSILRHPFNEVLHGWDICVAEILERRATASETT